MKELVKVRKKLQKTISCRLQFIISAQFMASSLTNLLNNFAEEIHKFKCKYGHNEKNVKLVESSINIVTAFLYRLTLKMI